MGRIPYFPFYAVSLFPISVLYLMSNLLYVIAYHIIGYRRWVVRENLMRAFPMKSDAEIVSIEKDFYHHFSDIGVESIKTLTIGKKNAKERLKVKNPQLPLDVLKK